MTTSDLDRSEPAWMTELRERSRRRFHEASMATWCVDHLPDVATRHLHDLLLTVEQVDRWCQHLDEPLSAGEQIRSSERVPQHSAGATAQHEFEVADHRRRADLAEQGILFCDLHTALHDYPHLVQEYLGTVISPGDDKFAALNTALWSHGSFLYVPPGVEVDMPLQDSLSRRHRQGAEPFERTLIIADEGSAVTFIDGCSAPIHSPDSLHSTVVEIVVRPHARVAYATIQNWSSNVLHLVSGRARVETRGHIEWIDGTIGSKLTVTSPAVHLVGEGATGDVLSVADAGEGQHQHVGAEIVHAAANTQSSIVSRSISQDGGVTSCRGLVRVQDGAQGCTSRVECDALTLDQDSVSMTALHVEAGEQHLQIEHRDTVSEVSAEQLFYLMSRGLSEEQAMGLIVSGFIEPITGALPTEYAVEWARLIELQMQRSVG